MTSFPDVKCIYLVKSFLTGPALDLISCTLVTGSHSYFLHTGQCLISLFPAHWPMAPISISYKLVTGSHLYFLHTGQWLTSLFPALWPMAHRSLLSTDSIFSFSTGSQLSFVHWLTFSLLATGSHHSFSHWITPLFYTLDHITLLVIESHHSFSH